MYNIVTTILHPVQMTRKIRRILCLKSVLFLSGFVQKILDNEMKWETRCNTPPPSPFSFVYGLAFTYLGIISHHCNASESNFKENLDIQHNLIHQKSSNLVNLHLLAYATSVEV